MEIKEDQPEKKLPLTLEYYLNSKSIASLEYRIIELNNFTEKLEILIEMKDYKGEEELKLILLELTHLQAAKKFLSERLKLYSLTKAFINDIKNKL